MTPTSSPIPIAFCITDLDVGGAERALVQLVTRLDRREWNPVVFCLSGPGTLVLELEAALVPVICLGANRDDGLFRRLRIVWLLARELRALSPRPRLLQTFLFHANLAGRIAGRLAGIKRIVSGIRVAEQRARWHLWLDWLTNWLVDLNVCVSQSVADFTRAHGWLRGTKLTVIPNVVDYERFAQGEPADLTSLGIPRESRVIVTVGRLDEQKGHRFLIEALPAVLREHHDARLLVVGDGPLREELQALARQLGIAEAVCFAGHRDDVPALLRASKCFVLPSLWEGMPNVVLEAMAAGVPVVTTSVEGVLELIEPDRTGLVVKVGNATEISSALNR
ncbi:MAG: glycosyltransferase, partial [Planctomycetales bacterium]|nr:glycosyltransferase [Planctomycetales bacterium]